MREIKFRGKSKLDGRWVYGSLISIGNDWCQIVPTGTEYDDILTNMVRVITDTVGQFIGVQDKKKVNIFIGDIVKADGGLVVYAGWSEQTHGFIWKNDTGFTAYIGNSDPSIVEVIGNIYENPELIN